MTRDEQRQAEMEAGRIAVERVARLDLFNRIMRSHPDLNYKVCLSGHKYWVHGEYNIVVELDHKEIWHGDKEARSFPPDELMAILGLAVQSLDLKLPPIEPTHHVSQEGRAYRQQIAAYNAKRWETNDE